MNTTKGRRRIVTNDYRYPVGVLDFIRSKTFRDSQYSVCVSDGHVKHEEIWTLRDG